MIRGLWASLQRLCDPYLVCMLEAHEWVLIIQRTEVDPRDGDTVPYQAPEKLQVCRRCGRIERVP